ncbi:YARHG domain-containing protein [Faecalicatena contorta]|uniref:YARHG domain-containing protein n=1 Tax=Faecalicatena contorta TaxID=39482 RepID=A0A316AFI0_9FIRM|nr:YARHG domain-containing protein [Faecalicatena contorta]PWJ48557.1 YARHG domain-containing protein [Faecalicatena contorta]SUQ15293.1 YARHG domain-containing protein [Faecalicatena contorta]
MDKIGKKGMFKILAGVLPVLIVVAAVIGGVLVSASISPVSGFSEDVTKTAELKAVMPKEDEKKLTNRVIVSASGSSKEENTDEDKKPADEMTEDYVLPNSNTQPLTDADIEGLSLQELNYAKNEIYARHGRKFDSKELQDYFESKSWYEGKYDGKEFDANYSGRVLSEVEKKNVEFLYAAENKMSSGGYKFE